MREIAIGSRGSKLAVIQAEELQTSLREVFPELKTSLVKIKTTGDRFGATSLDEFAGQGIFVKELEKALLDNQIDLAVHSLKDLPTEIPQGLMLAAVTSRLDPRDVFISGDRKLADLAPGSKIGTGSPRRAVQLLALRPDLQVCDIRGNIDTRLRKVSDGEFDGVVVAAAAMIRLGWQEKITEYLPIEHFTPAVGQGTLGIEVRSEDKEIAALVSKINDQPTWQAVTAERTFLQTLGGGCRAPIAALGTVSAGTLKLTGMVAGADGSQILRAAEQGKTSTPEQIGKRLARKMADMGALILITATE
ncbi:MAG: hydroxymethylbilane synthase [Chloroflexi bacterium RBG_13_48_17]|nr:MAG: hydroxymethylbilane synthase [Chloroflexi bacterium RBG_13_48_17]